MAATNVTVPSLGGLQKSALVAIGVLALYFSYDQVIPYFIWSEDSYGYYWQFRTSLLFHVIGGFVALLAGLFQLWSGLNRKAMRTHPVTGRVYVAAVVIGSLGAFALAATSGVYGFAWAIALVSLGVAWLATTSVAVYCIRHRNINAHKQWMIRSYIVTFAFVTFRIVIDYLPYESMWGLSGRYG